MIFGIFDSSRVSDFEANSGQVEERCHSIMGALSLQIFILTVESNRLVYPLAPVLLLCKKLF